MNAWEVLLLLIVGAFILGLGVIIGAAAALGARKQESEDIDIP